MSQKLPEFIGHDLGVPISPKVTVRRLSPQVQDILADRHGSFPVWIRAPKFGTEFYSGFSRAKLYESAGKGYIRSVSIRSPGQVKGTRLFKLESILSYIEKCEAEAKEGN